MQDYSLDGIIHLPAYLWEGNPHGHGTYMLYFHTDSNLSSRIKPGTQELWGSSCHLKINYLYILHILSCLHPVLIHWPMLKLSADKNKKLGSRNVISLQSGTLYSVLCNFWKKWVIPQRGWSTKIRCISNLDQCFFFSKMRMQTRPLNNHNQISLCLWEKTVYSQKCS